MKTLIHEALCALYATTLVLATLILTGCTSLPEAYTADRPDAEQLALKATVRVLRGTPQFNPRNARYDFAMVCYGVAVGPTKVRTAAHCVDQCVTRDNQTTCSEGKVFAVATAEQWFLHTNFQTPVVQIAVVGPDLAELTLSEPVQDWTDLAHGRAAFAVYRDAVYYGPTPLQEGDSGSGMFDAVGRVIGIVSRARLEVAETPEYEEM